MYPRIDINLEKLISNANHILELCHLNNIEPMFVGKVLAGDVTSIEKVLDCGFKYYADSRLSNLIMINKEVKKVLLRIPGISDVRNVVSIADISLNSELETIISLNKEAKNQNKIHEIILMFDLGDLREGIFYQSNYLPIIKEILNLKNIKLIGIGTNLTCYGGVIPTYDNLQILINIKKKVKSQLNYDIELLSGGNSSSITLMCKGLMPKSINNLRIGEALVLGRETAYGKLIKGMHTDIFTVVCEIIELKSKPSFPIGTVTMDAFGNVPDIKNKGLMKRGIASLGKQDVLFENITPIDSNITIIGGSSDHLILDLTNTNYKLGDFVSFKPNYPGLLQLMTSSYIYKNYLN